MTKIAFFNHKPESEIESIGNAILSAVEESNFRKLDSVTGVAAIELDPSITLCIFHGFPDSWDYSAFKKGGTLDRDTAMLICSISSAPLESKIEAIEGAKTVHCRFNVPNLHAAKLLGGTETDLNASWKEFISALINRPYQIGEDGSVIMSERILSFLHHDPTAHLAFRFLCEAWSEVNANQNMTLSGFPISAPSKLDNWLAPFAPDGNDDATKIASVVAKMGDKDTKDKVGKVLANANGDPKEHVLAFLGIAQEPAAQTAGGAQ